METYNDKKYENSSGIHSGGSDFDSNIDKTNYNFIAQSRSNSVEPETECEAFNERLRSASMKVN